MNENETDALFEKLQSEPIEQGTSLIYWDSNDPGCGMEGPLHLTGWWWSKEPAFLINCFIRLLLSVSAGKHFGIEKDCFDTPLEEVMELATKQGINAADEVLIASLKKWEASLKEEMDPQKRIVLFNDLAVVLKGKKFHLKATMYDDYHQAVPVLKRHGAEFDEGDLISSFEYDQCEDGV